MRMICTNSSYHFCTVLFDQTCCVFFIRSVGRLSINPMVLWIMLQILTCLSMWLRMWYYKVDALVSTTNSTLTSVH